MPDMAARRPLRAEARRNHERIVAAHEAFAAHGAGASPEEIARRAGVGPAPLHRPSPPGAGCWRPSSTTASRHSAPRHTGTRGRANRAPPSPPRRANCCTGGSSRARPAPASASRPARTCQHHLTGHRASGRRRTGAPTPGHRDRRRARGVPGVLINAGAARVTGRRIAPPTVSGGRLRSPQPAARSDAVTASALRTSLRVLQPPRSAPTQCLNALCR